MATTHTQDTNHDTRLPPEQINARLDTLGEIATQRMRQCAPDFSCTVGGAAIDFMTTEERAERHALMLQLPSFAEEALAARARLKERISQRRGRTEQVANL